MTSSPWFPVGLIAGAAAGAFLALVAAPRSGRETIEALRRHFDRAKDEARRAGEDAEAEILTRYQAVRSASVETQPDRAQPAPAAR